MLELHTFAHTKSELILAPFLSTSSGDIGSTVVIRGSNFGLPPAANIVCFGAVKAIVTSAATSSLTVTVPPGATYAPVSVTVAGLTAYSRASFVVTFESSRLIDAGTFPTKIDFAESNPSKIAVGDLDGDGRPDVVSANTQGSSLTVYRNVSTGGPLSRASFVTSTISTDVRPSDLVIADLDGDGKQDIAVVYYSGSAQKVSIFRNTGSVGNPTFASGVNSIDAFVSHSIAACDLDGDGKPELVVGNVYSSWVSVLRNTSSMGALSFAPKLDLTTVSGNEGLTVSDLDGDGKPDLVVGNGAGSLSILRNTSTGGSLSFAAKSDLDLGGPSLYDVFSADLDGDGRPDLIAPTLGTVVILFRNTSTNGAISFEPRFSLTALNYARSAALGDLDGDGKPDLVVGNFNSQQLSIFKNLSSIGSLNASSFAARVDLSPNV